MRPQAPQARRDPVPIWQVDALDHSWQPPRQLSGADRSANDDNDKSSPPEQPNGRKLDLVLLVASIQEGQVLLHARSWYVLRQVRLEKSETLDIYFNSYTFKIKIVFSIS